MPGFTRLIPLLLVFRLGAAPPGPAAAPDTLPYQFGTTLVAGPTSADGPARVAFANPYLGMDVGDRFDLALDPQPTDATVALEVPDATGQFAAFPLAAKFTFQGDDRKRLLAARFLVLAVTPDKGDKAEHTRRTAFHETYAKSDDKPAPKASGLVCYLPQTSQDPGVPTIRSYPVRLNTDIEMDYESSQDTFYLVNPFWKGDLSPMAPSLVAEQALDFSVKVSGIGGQGPTDGTQAAKEIPLFTTDSKGKSSALKGAPLGQLSAAPLLKFEIHTSNSGLAPLSATFKFVPEPGPPSSPWNLVVTVPPLSLALDTPWDEAVSPGQIASVRKVVELENTLLIHHKGNLFQRRSVFKKNVLQLPRREFIRALNAAQMNAAKLLHELKQLKATPQTTAAPDTPKAGAAKAPKTAKAAPPAGGGQGAAADPAPVGGAQGEPAVQTPAQAQAVKDLERLGDDLQAFWRDAGGEGSLPHGPHSGKLYYELFLAVDFQQVNGDRIINEQNPPLPAPSGTPSSAQNFYGAEVTKAFHRDPSAWWWLESYCNLNYSQHVAETRAFRTDSSSPTTDPDYYNLVLGKQSFEAEVGGRPFMFMVGAPFPEFLSGTAVSPIVAFDYTTFSASGANPANIGVTRRLAGGRIEEVWSPTWKGSFFELARLQDPLIPSQPNRLLWRGRAMYHTKPAKGDILRNLMVEFDLNQGFHNSSLRQDPISLRVGFSLSIPMVVQAISSKFRAEEEYLIPAGE